MNPMSPLTRLSIKHKLIVLIMAVCLTTLLLVVSGFSIHEHNRLQENVVSQTRSMAHVIANRSVAALVFDDAKLCQENLESLQSLTTIRGAGIYAGNGRLIARYKDLDTTPIELNEPPATPFHQTHRGHLWVFHPIHSEGKPIGTLVIASSLEAMRSTFRRYLLLALGMLALGLLAAFKLSAWLQGFVSEPISELTLTARQIKDRKDYRLRARKIYNDELGILAESFNGMLTQIQIHERELKAANEHLEAQVQSRTLELLTALNQMEAIFDAATCGINLVKDRIIVRCNRRMGELFGYELSEMTGKSTRMWYPDDASFEDVGAQLATCVATGTRFFREQWLVRKDGSRFLGRITAQIADRMDPAAGLVGIFEDITPDKAKEEALQQALEAAQVADQLKSAFLASMSHELRTPLNSIIGFTGILLQGMVGPLNPEQKKQLAIVKDSSRHLLDLINDVLDISKIEAGQLTLSVEQVKVQDSVQKVLGNTRILAENKGLRLELHSEGELPIVSCDQRRLEQILLNLVSNAIKFTDTGFVRVECLNQDKAVLIRVVDSGIGIKGEDMDRLFKPFSQVDTGLSRKYEGTGLGLSICKRLVELMGGKIWVESQLNQGSTFAFTLPAR